MIGTQITVWHAGRFGRAIIVETREDAWASRLYNKRVSSWWYEIVPDETYMVQGSGFARSNEEGINWAAGWDAETLGALRAARVLSDARDFPNATVGHAR